MVLLSPTKPHSGEVRVDRWNKKPGKFDLKAKYDAADQETVNIFLLIGLVKDARPCSIGSLLS